MKNILLIAALLFNTCLSSGQTPVFDWAHSFGAEYMDGSNAIVTDDKGNSYSIGYFNFDVDFDPGPDTFILHTSEGGYRNICAFILKLSPSGSLVWAKQLRPKFAIHGYSFGRKIVLDDFGNLYCSGCFGDTVDFDPGTGTAYIIGAERDLFILKLTVDGDFVWAKKLAGNHNEDVLSIATDKSGNVYTTGWFESDSIDMDPGPSVFFLKHSGPFHNMFISKLDSAGHFAWAGALHGSGYGFPNGIKVDRNKNMLIGGDFTGTIDFDPGIAINNRTPEGEDDMFLLKLDSNGKLVWLNTLGGEKRDLCTDITLDDTGNIYSTGKFGSSLDFDLGTGVAMMTPYGAPPYDVGAYILKTAADGKFSWVKGPDGVVTPDAITIDKYGGVYTTGHFIYTTDFNPGSGIYTLDSYKGWSYVWKLDRYGNFGWVVNFGDDDSPSQGVMLAVDYAGNIYTTGTFKGTIDFDPDPLKKTLLKSRDTDVDFYIQRLTQPKLDIAGKNSSGELRVYPNPAKDFINVAFQSIHDAPFVINNILGQPVSSGLIKARASCTNILLSSLSAGFYFLCITPTDGPHVAIKFVKQ